MSFPVHSSIPPIRNAKPAQSKKEITEHKQLAIHSEKEKRLAIEMAMENAIVWYKKIVKLFVEYKYMIFSTLGFLSAFSSNLFMNGIYPNIFRATKLVEINLPSIFMDGFPLFKPRRYCFMDDFIELL